MTPSRVDLNRCNEMRINVHGARRTDSRAHLRVETRLTALIVAEKVNGTRVLLRRRGDDGIMLAARNILHVCQSWNCPRGKFVKIYLQALIRKNIILHSRGISMEVLSLAQYRWYDLFKGTGCPRRSLLYKRKTESGG